MNLENTGTQFIRFSLLVSDRGARALKASSHPDGPEEQIPESADSTELAFSVSWNAGPGTNIRF